MDDLIRSKLENFLKTYEVLNHEYKWSSTYLVNSFTSLIYTISDVQYNHALFDSMHKFVKENTGVFSHFRGYDRFFILALLITKFGAPKEAFLKLSKIEEKMHEEKFSKSTYSGLAAYCILTCCEEGSIDICIKGSKEMYQKMKEKHFWLTGQDDYPLAVLLSLSGNDASTINDNIEMHYNSLNNAGFSKGNSLQFLSHILSFSNDAMENKIDRCLKIMHYFKERKLKFTSFQYGILGLISLVYNDNTGILDNIIETYEYLGKVKGIKWSGRDVLLLLSSSLVINTNIESHKNNSELLEAALGISLQGIIAAQTAAMVASISAVSAATTASASS